MGRKTADSDQTTEKTPPATRNRSWAAKGLIVVLAAAASAAGILWWQDRDLRAARAALAASDAEQALKLSEEYLVHHPDSPTALALKARSLVALREEPEEAVKIFDRIGLADLDEMHAYAQAQLMLDQWSLALPHLTRVVEERPDDAQALHEITACRIRLGMLQAALDSASQAADCEGHEAKGYVLLGVIYRELNDHRQSAAAFEQVLKFDPDAASLQLTPAEFLRQYGRALLDAGEPAKAAPQLERSLSLEASAEGYTALGEAYVLLGKPAEAAQAWKSAVELDPLHDEARQGLAALALRDKDPKRALEWLKPLESQGKGLSTTALMLAETYKALQDEGSSTRWRQMAESAAAREKQAEQIKRRLVEDPGSVWSRAVRAHQFATAGNWRQAQAVLDDLPDDVGGELKDYIGALREGVEKRQPPPPIGQAPIPMPEPAARPGGEAAPAAVESGQG